MTTPAAASLLPPSIKLDADSHDRWLVRFVDQHDTSFYLHVGPQPYWNEAAVRACVAHALAGQWIAVSERLPDDWGSTLVRTNGGTEIAYFQLKDGGRDGRKAGKWYGDDDEETWHVTHWMTLPEGPKS